jgi:glycosyltransferase involved in cell wall biosynthesis
LPPEVWSADNLIVAPGISQNQLLGLIRHLLAMPPRQRPRVICQLMFSPAWVPWGRKATLGHRLYRQAFSLAGGLTGKTLFFTAENQAMADLYRGKFGIKPKILPIPFGEMQAAAVTMGRPRLGFFGYSKAEKGFHLLPQAIEICQSKGLDADFVIQVQHSGWEPGTFAAEQELRRMQGVRLIDGILETDDYIAETSKIDVMLLPYDPLLFGLRGSGILTESAGAGRPIIASAGTFAAQSIEAGDAEGEIFKPYNATELGAAIARLLPELAARRTRATERAAAFARSHNADAYVDILLAYARR